MSLTERESAARRKVLDIFNEQNVESYVAYDHTTDEQWLCIGGLDYVCPQQDLIEAWSNIACRISYHHTHPVDRALSPSDLRTLYNPGLKDIWAHCPCGMTYRASLFSSESAAAFRDKHEHLNGTASKELLHHYMKDIKWTNFLPNDFYENYSDLAFCNALQRDGQIKFDAMAVDDGPRVAPNEPALMLLVEFAQAILERRYPQPPVT